MDIQPPTPLVQKIQLFPFPIFLKRELTYASSFLLLISVSLLVLNHIGRFQLSSLHTGFEGCDYSYGTWVRDESNSLPYYTEECPFLDPGFQCHRNGRKDDDYVKWRWQPQGCDLPRFNARDLLERSRNGRIVFAGDSLGRNQWESLVCMLAQGVSNQSRIYEENGNPITKHKGYLSMRFHGYNLTVEYYRVPFLVQVDRPPEKSSAQVRSAIQVDHLHWRSQNWIGANVLVFNAGHWWNNDKTYKMGCYFQEGGLINATMTTKEAFHKSLQTWKSWVVQNLNPINTHIFFRSYSPVHYRNGTWNTGGDCNSYTRPETKYKKLETQPWNNLFVYKTIEQIQNVYKNAQYLNITYLTEFRKDGHPSNHLGKDKSFAPLVQDCSHWCLPGVPDTWNELLYAQLLSRDYKTPSTKQKTWTNREKSSR